VPRAWKGSNPNSILFYSILFYSILFCSIFYSILFYSILFYSILFYSILFYSIFPSSPEAKNECGYTSLLLYVFMSRRRTNLVLFIYLFLFFNTEYGIDLLVGDLTAA